MAYSDLSPNQTISFNNLQSGVTQSAFTLKNSIPPSLEQITKADAAYYVNINQGYGPFAAKTNNQLVVKSDMQACASLPYSYTLYYDYHDGLPVVIGTSIGLVCSLTNSFTVYSSSSSIGVGSALYFDICGYNQIIATSYIFPEQAYYKIGSNSYITFENSGGIGYIVRTISSCVVGYDFYTADEYSCAFPCDLYAADQIVAFPAGSSVVNNKWYHWSGETSSFKITGTTIDPGYAVPLLGTDMTPYNNCDLACYV